MHHKRLMRNFDNNDDDDDGDDDKKHIISFAKFNKINIDNGHFRPFNVVS
jgi:hypothetical protein